MMSMRAMMLENELDDTIGRFARLRGELEKLVPMTGIEADSGAWIYGPKDDEGWRIDDEVDPREQIGDVREILLEMLDTTHKIDGLLTVRTYLNS